MFTINGDGTYTVRFFNNGKADYVTVDSQLPTDSTGHLVFANMGASATSSSNTLWVALAEKAYVQMNEAGWLRKGMSGSGQNSYIAISGGYVGDAFTQVANQAYAWASPSSTSFSTFATAFATGKMIELGSNGNPNLSTIVGGHAYAVVGINTTNQTVTVFNPWGINNGSSKPGLVTLTWAQLQSNFAPGLTPRRSPNSFGLAGARSITDPAPRFFICESRRSHDSIPFHLPFRLALTFPFTATRVMVSSRTATFHLRYWPTVVK